ncbi:cutinase family protein [Actinoplanes sp. M2I2]|uniref:cutinase family protein n=1 Tax=Actinoplanes sp. M2I2 TaxID=1734444 RepID=UPI0020201A49|nr:cutinase family protein [Actinoplanes sp. M2I2]
MARRRVGARKSRRFLTAGICAAVVATGAVVTPQAFAGTTGSSSASAGGGSFIERLRARFGQGGNAGGGNTGGNAGGNTGGNAGGGNAGGQNGAGCSDVELVFARGTGEPQGLGILGRPLAQALADELPNQSVGSFAVVYAAASNQRSAGPGATNMTQHIQQVAQSCPETQFVIGGYSQGASVTDIAIGIRGAGTQGEAIPAALRDRVAAVVVYGNPLGIRRQTIARAAPEFADRAVEFCATGDPVCGGGNNFSAHLSYARNGDVQDGAEFAAGKIGG